MTTFGWDTSNYDDPPWDLDGIQFFTHKAGEGNRFYYDREYKQSMNNVLGMGCPIVGAYFVNHPGSVEAQVDWFIQILDQDTPWWRKHPCFILQIDAEKFDYMSRAPSPQEIQAFGDRLVNVHGVMPSRVVAYAPQWLYGQTLKGLSYRLWASAYGGNPVGHYRAVYPGDQDGKRWQAYSGQTPLILQYGSNTTIAGQTTCDANAYRGTLEELLATFGVQKEMVDSMYAVTMDDKTVSVTNDDWSQQFVLPADLAWERAYWRQQAGLPADKSIPDPDNGGNPKAFPASYRPIFGAVMGTDVSGGGSVPAPGGVVDVSKASVQEIATASAKAVAADPEGDGTDR